MKNNVHKTHRILLIVISVIFSAQAITLDSLKERLITTFDLLPDYYMRFDISAFALHRDSFQKRNYLAEPHPQLQFCFLSYKDIVASVWDVDFQFGLGEVPGNVVFTVLNVQFGIEPAIEFRIRNWNLDVGIAHRCIHEIDRKDFAVIYFNRLFSEASSRNYNLNQYWDGIHRDFVLTLHNRIAWSGEFSYYLRDFFGLTSPNKLNGSSANLWDASVRMRYAFWKRKSWVFALTSETKFGIYRPEDGFKPQKNLNWYGSQIVGYKGFFSRGKRGACGYIDYNLDKLPIPVNQPSFAEGKSRFSKNGLLQFGIIFFN